MTASEQSLHDRFAGLQPEDAGDGYWQLNFTSLGSDCEIFYHAPGVAEAIAYGQGALHWLARFEARWSRYLEDSQLSKINRQAGGGWTETDPELETLLDLCSRYHFATDGVFDATSLPLSRLWDWRQLNPVPPTPEVVAQALSLTGWEKVEREKGRVRLAQLGMQLDLGGIGKEFAVDCVAGLAGGFGISSVMVDLGGDIAVLGESPEGGPWEVGLADPLDPSRHVCGIQLTGGSAVATSGDYRRHFVYEGRRYGHIIDSRTGYPVAHATRACSVIAARCTAAGILSTSAMVLGGKEAMDMLDRTFGAEGCVWHQGQLLESRGFHRLVLPAGWDAEEDAKEEEPAGMAGMPS